MVRNSKKSEVVLKQNQGWTNYSLQDNTWAGFSTLEVGVCVCRTLQARAVKQANLELKVLKSLL